MSDGTGKLKTVRIMNQSMCIYCRFAGIATVHMASGAVRSMFHCKRLDCDNWETYDNGDKPISMDPER